jgi:hypothetical protein
MVQNDTEEILQIVRGLREEIKESKRKEVFSIFGGGIVGSIAGYMVDRLFVIDASHSLSWSNAFWDGLLVSLVTFLSSLVIIGTYNLTVRLSKVRSINLGSVFKINYAPQSKRLYIEINSKSVTFNLTFGENRR